MTQRMQTFTALGSGYDLSRRDMEMRGYGTIFGTEQSGAKDVGLDLQAAILRNAVDSLKHELIIAVPECRVNLDMPLEKMFSANIGPLPHSSDLNEIARWEGLLTKQILMKFAFDIKGTKASRSLNNSTKRDPTHATNDGVVNVDSLMREYLSASTSEKLIALIAGWEKKYPNVSSRYSIDDLHMYLLFRFLVWFASW